MNYTKPKGEVINFENSDIITLSGCTQGVLTYSDCTTNLNKFGDWFCHNVILTSKTIRNDANILPEIGPGMDPNARF